jgi:hypothetical protein
MVDDVEVETPRVHRGTQAQAKIPQKDAEAGAITETDEV